MKTIEKEVRKNGTVRVKLNCGEGLTEQAHKKECDMNYILRNYQKTGMIKHAREHEGRYDDVTAIDFQEAQIIVANAKTMFEELPANLRKRFSNNPAEFLDFAQNPENKQELSKMGIIRGNDGIDITGATTTAPVADTPPAKPPAEPEPTPAV